MATLRRGGENRYAGESAPTPGCRGRPLHGGKCGGLRGNSGGDPEEAGLGRRALERSRRQRILGQQPSQPGGRAVRGHGLASFIWLILLTLTLPRVLPKIDWSSWGELGLFCKNGSWPPVNVLGASTGRRLVMAGRFGTQRMDS